MRKVVRLTESDLVRIVKRVVNEQQNPKNPNQFCAVCREWEDVDDSVYREGKWMVKGNKITIYYKGVLGNQTQIISKPNGFDSWSKGVSNGKFIGNPEAKVNGIMDIPSKLFSEDTYKICFSK